MKHDSTRVYQRVLSLSMVLMIFFHLDARSGASPSKGRQTAEVSEDRTITGKVTQKEDGSGLQGVNVVIKGTQQGNTTEAARHYPIEISGDN